MLIAMAVWNTVENQRYDCTVKTIDSLLTQVDTKSHPIYIVNNASTDPRTAPLLERLSAYGRATIITNETNLGTARAINRAWKFRKPGQCCVKMDDDVVVHQKDWPDLMEEVFRRDTTIGIVGFKRNDCWENPAHENEWFKSHLYMLPHQPNERWIVAEHVHHVIGTCQAYSSTLLDKMGYLLQFGPYGLDDSLSAVRCEVSGLKSVFIPHVPIDHVDNVQREYTDWKKRISEESVPKFLETIAAYRNGTLPIYWEDKD
jgi:GT2 family glycosyltransferase